MPEILPRTAWDAAKPACTTQWDLNDLQGICLHHFGTPRAVPFGQADEQLRGVQRTHMAPGGLGSPTGGCDIAYNFAVHLATGSIFELRGWRNQSGANGTNASNRTHLAVVLMGDTDKDGFPEIAQDSTAWLFKQAFNKGVGVSVVPHRRFTGSACPGDRAHEWVTSNAWKKDLPSSRRVRFLLLDDGKVLDRSNIVPVDESNERWRIFCRNQEDRAHRHMVQEGKTGAVQFARKVLLG